MLFAEGDFWGHFFNNLPQTILAISTIVAIIWGKDHISKKISEVKEDVKENTEVTKDVANHVDAKADSAVRAAENAAVQAKQITDAAANRVGALIAKTLGDKAERTADRVADIAFKNSAAIADRVEKVVQYVKGTDGTCLTNKVEEHGKAIEQLKQETEAVKQKVNLIEGDTKQILDILSTRGGGI